MELHWTQSVRTLALGCALLSVLLAILLSPVQTFPHQRTLLCHFCPLQAKSKSCNNVTTRCLPDEVCVSSRGHYGEIHVLSAQGCIRRGLCGSHEIQTYHGIRLNVSHTCCFENQCNPWEKSEFSLEVLIWLLKEMFKNGLTIPAL